MPSPANPPEAALSVARQLSQQVEGLRGDLDAKFTFLSAYTRRTRIMLVITIVSLVLDLILTGLFVGSEVQLRHEQGKIAANAASVSQVHKSALGACAIGNELRSKQLSVWNELLALSVPPPPHSKTAHRLAVFVAFYRHAYQQLDCKKLYPPPNIHH